MSRDPRYDILFEPVKIGPVTARNRFYQVPHCNGFGWRHPNSLSTMRGIKAEGGWSVVSTEEVEIHHTSDVAPFVEGRLWDDGDIPQLKQMTDAVHAHGSLAAIELNHNGHTSPNLFSRSAPIAPAHMPVDNLNPVQARAMDKEDIRNFRKWHLDAAIRSKQAGYDIVYVYAGHCLTLPMHFMSARYNDRIDEYGGSLQNRIRLFKEVIEETKDAIGDTCGVVVRFAVDELMGNEGLQHDGEAAEIVSMIAELPDLWDVNVASWKNDSMTARFADEGYQEQYVKFVKDLTTKPVVGVGRFTSPDAMVSQIKRGVLDMIGAARPSIADPFLPKKIEEGRMDDIRECIGCNICVSADLRVIPIRCTQNPTMGEEWRRGWHPEKIEPAASDDAVLVVGSGPAGLEAAMQLSKRGYPVTIAEAGSELGGRINAESQLPGLNSYVRVRDHRQLHLTQAANVDIYFDSKLGADEILEFGFSHVYLATGSKWQKDGLGRSHRRPIKGLKNQPIYSPDDIMANHTPSGHAVIFDDDHYYMASVLAEKLIAEGCQVTYVTNESKVASWTDNTMEQGRIQKRLMELGVKLEVNNTLTEITIDGVKLSCSYTGQEKNINCDAVVLVTQRKPQDDIYHDLMARPDDMEKAGIKTLRRIGDCNAPGIVEAAVFAGHQAAREHEVGEDLPFKRERVVLEF